jgi:hypothetical protein
MSSPVAAAIHVSDKRLVGATPRRSVPRRTKLPHVRFRVS